MLVPLPRVSPEDAVRRAVLLHGDAGEIAAAITCLEVEGWHAEGAVQLAGSLWRIVVTGQS